MTDLHFSYSSLNDLITCPHSWINKMLKIKKPDYGYFKEGKDGHRIIQDHIGDIKPYEKISYLEERFEIVEEKDFDPRCKFEIEVGGYKIIGYLDAHSPSKKKLGEIKLSSSPWSQGKYRSSPQRKIYALAFPSYDTGILITGSRDSSIWDTNRLIVREIPLTAQDRKEGEDWIKKGLQIFEEGDFTGGLDENGRCVDPRCPYGKNCYARQ